MTLPPSVLRDVCAARSAAAIIDALESAAVAYAEMASGALDRLHEAHRALAAKNAVIAAQREEIRSLMGVTMPSA